MNLGVLLCQAGREDAGIALFEDLLREREEADVHGNLATALLQEGRADEAAPHLRRFLELEPGHAQAASVRRLLQSLEIEK
jgi:tetratricopeptide (TPR) repeat protein